MIKDGVYIVHGKGKLIESALKGLAVPRYGYETRVSALSITSDMIEALTALYSLMALTQFTYVGVWHTSEGLHFNLVEIVADEMDAIQLGKKRGATLIWDIDSNEAIDLSKYPFIVQDGKYRGISSVSLEAAQGVVDGAKLKARNDFQRD